MPLVLSVGVYLHDLLSLTHGTNEASFSMRNYFSTRSVWDERLSGFERRRSSSRRATRESSVLYLRAGAVKLTVVNAAGKEAVVEILGPGDFFGRTVL